MTTLRRALAAAGIVAATLLVASPAFAEPTKVGKECIEKLEKGGSIDDCQKAPSPLKPETNEILWGTASFLVLFVVMWKFALPPVRNMMKAREDRIRGDLERAESAKNESEAELAKYQAQLAEARGEAGRIIEEARQAADQVRRDLMARAEAEAAEARARAQADIRLATDRAMADLRQQVASVSIELAEKIVERNLDAATQQSLIDSYIAKVGSN